MNLLSDVIQALKPLKIQVETGVFTGNAPDRYIVITPLSDSFNLYADNLPEIDIQEVRLSFFDKGNYMQTKNAIVRALIAADLTVTDRRYVGHEDNTGYHHYAIDVAKNYIF